MGKYLVRKNGKFSESSSLSGKTRNFLFSTFFFLEWSWKTKQTRQSVHTRMFDSCLVCKVIDRATSICWIIPCEIIWNYHQLIRFSGESKKLLVCSLISNALFMLQMDQFRSHSHFTYVIFIVSTNHAHIHHAVIYLDSAWI